MRKLKYFLIAILCVFCFSSYGYASEEISETPETGSSEETMEIVQEDENTDAENLEQEIAVEDEGSQQNIIEETHVETEESISPSETEQTNEIQMQEEQIAAVSVETKAQTEAAKSEEKAGIEKSEKETEKEIEKEIKKPVVVKDWEWVENKNKIVDDTISVKIKKDTVYTYYILKHNVLPKSIKNKENDDEISIVGWIKRKEKDEMEDGLLISDPIEFVLKAVVDGDYEFINEPLLRVRTILIRLNNQHSK